MWLKILPWSSAGTALELGNFRSHATLALAVRRMTSYEWSSGTRLDRSGNFRTCFKVDFRISSGREHSYFPEQDDVVLINAQHRERIRFQLQTLWQPKLRLGGLLIGHDVDTISIPLLQEALQPSRWEVIADDRGREQGMFWKGDS